MKLYRIEYRVDFDDKVTLKLIEFEVVRHTPKGFWIIIGYDTKKWIPANAKQAYAYMTIKKAKVNFIKRNQTRKRILEYQLNNVQESLKLINTFYKNH